MNSHQLLASLADKFSTTIEADGAIVFYRGQGDAQEKLVISVQIKPESDCSDAEQIWTLKNNGKSTWCYSLESVIAAVNDWLPSQMSDEERTRFAFDRPKLQRR